MSRDYYDQADHKCYWYFMGEPLAENVYAAYKRPLLDILPEGVCSLVTGRSQHPLQTILYTHGKHEPPLIRQSFGMIRQNTVNVWRLHDAFEHLQAEIVTCTNPPQRQKFVYRYIGNQHCIDALMRQGLTIDQDTGIGTYPPAFPGTRNGISPLQGAEHLAQPAHTDEECPCSPPSACPVRGVRGSQGTGSGAVPEKMG